MDKEQDKLFKSVIEEVEAKHRWWFLRWLKCVFWFGQHVWLRLHPGKTGTYYICDRCDWIKFKEDS